jgi:oxygen-independent coproporphyrinogen-3 oxidase
MDDALAAGFPFVSVDLIFGVPGGSPDEFARALRAVAGRGISHVSTYALTFEPGTPLQRALRRGEIAPVDEEEVIAMFDAADEILGSRGLVRYEVSNFARPGDECRHNLTYWHRGEYRGLGAAAHSFIDGVRFWNTPTVLGYSRAMGEGMARSGSERLTCEQERTERIMLGLRLLTEGVRIEDLRPADGTRSAEAPSNLPALIAGGLVEQRQGRVLLTRQGLLVADRVALELVV